MTEPRLIRATSSTTTHLYDREVPSRFGRRYVARCGATMYVVDTHAGALNCAGCIRREATAALGLPT